MQNISKLFLAVGLVLSSTSHKPQWLHETFNVSESNRPSESYNAGCRVDGTEGFIERDGQPNLEFKRNGKEMAVGWREYNGTITVGSLLNYKPRTGDDIDIKEDIARRALTFIADTGMELCQSMIKDAQERHLHSGEHVLTGHAGGFILSALKERPPLLSKGLGILSPP